MSDIADVTVLDGGWSSEKPCVIFDAATARWGLDNGKIEEWLTDALAALDLSGKPVVLIEGSDV